ncbi:hypothetical protein BCR33DRAFT_198047 [Rhizoclosmatium globosum]|uniref:Uncharacterized protein n=1 Tax=Rhizoclosmatium globosum TaxID=329046 RepID=A0A1Y2CDZ8_9FUNG|nr:hypothetical protein BCR33DRAFT_198047 [Rhizoclosmatium globosum]|eukprot:ORY45290.1 hypothetical protein BCR33DRAFT_198047 [Rhizoclosmatium globosum]
MTTNLTSTIKIQWILTPTVFQPFQSPMASNSLIFASRIPSTTRSSIQHHIDAYLYPEEYISHGFNHPYTTPDSILHNPIPKIPLFTLHQHLLHKTNSKAISTCPRIREMVSCGVPAFVVWRSALQCKVRGFSCDGSCMGNVWDYCGSRW